VIGEGEDARAEILLSAYTMRHSPFAAGHLTGYEHTIVPECTEEYDSSEEEEEEQEGGRGWAKSHVLKQIASRLKQGPNHL